jgi:hypothetical protein
MLLMTPDRGIFACIVCRQPLASNSDATVARGVAVGRTVIQVGWARSQRVPLAICH